MIFQAYLVHEPGRRERGAESCGSVVMVWVGLVARATAGIGEGTYCHSGKFVTLAGYLRWQVHLKNLYCGSLLQQEMMEILHAVEFSGSSEKIVLNCNHNHVII